MMATDPAGVLVARTDRPSATGDDLSADPIVRRALDGEDSATLWRQGDQLFTAVAVPMQTGPELVGVLVAGYGLNEAVASQIRRLTHSEIAFLVQPPGSRRASPSRRWGRARPPSPPPCPARSSRGRTMAPFEIDLDGDRHIGVRIPLKAAGGEEIGAALALRSLAAETASFRQFRNSLVLVSLGVMALGLLAAWGAAARITGPGAQARAASSSGSATAPTPAPSRCQGRDEIGVLARAFNGLLADLREKDQMISLPARRHDRDAPGHAATPPGADRRRAPRRRRPGHGRDPLGGCADRRRSRRRRRPRPRAGLRRPLRGPRHARQGRHGRRLPRARPAARRGRGAQAAAARGPRAPTRRLLERFKQEIKLARRITHRNVLRTHDFGETGGVPYISMEYLEGVTLKDLVRSRGALPLGVGLSIAKQMCHGLGAAHDGGVVHRDIKPQNMLILPETAELKIMDFGISRVSSVEPGAAGLTTAGTVMGTPDYMPPEQAQGRPADFRSDLYSLAVVLFEIFTGKLPFKGETPMAVVVAHIQQAPPRPRSVEPEAPAGARGGHPEGAWQKDPAKRWQSADETASRP